MSSYAILFARSARKELERLPAREVGRIFAKIEDLASEPRPEGYRKLAGPGATWRIRVGVYRVLYAVDDDARVVDIIAVRHRRDAYR